MTTKTLSKKFFGNHQLGVGAVILFERKGRYTVVVKQGTSRREFDFLNLVLAEECFEQQCAVAEIEQGPFEG